MVTYHGVTAKLYWSRIAAEGKIIQEYLGLLNGSTAEQAFYTRNLPITTNAGVATDVETEVDVYSRDPAGATWVELDDDGSDFDIIGATGQVMVEEAYNQAGVANFPLSISYYTLVEVGMAQGVDIEVSRDIMEVYRLGSEDPQELKAGRITVSGSLRDIYTNRDLMGKILGKKDFYGTPADFSLYLYPNGTASPQPRIKVGNVTTGSGSLGIDVDALLSNDIEFRGLAVTIDTVP